MHFVKQRNMVEILNGIGDIPWIIIIFYINLSNKPTKIGKKKKTTKINNYWPMKFIWLKYVFSPSKYLIFRIWSLKNFSFGFGPLFFRHYQH